MKKTGAWVKDMKKSLTARLIMNMLEGVLRPLVLQRVGSCKEVLLLGSFPELCTHACTHARTRARATDHDLSCCPASTSQTALGPDSMI